MNSLLIALFLFSLFLLFYIYIGYALILKLFVLVIRPKGVRKSQFTPSVSVIIAAHNEEAVIRGRIEDIVKQEYPKQDLEIIVGSDGSTDATNKIVEDMSQGYGHLVRLLAHPAQRGRALVHNDAVKAARGEIVVFTDADTRFHSQFLQMLVSNFADEKVGCVSGSLFYTNTHSTSVSMGLGVYWRFENIVRQLETQLGSYCSSSGACMAIRKRIFKPLDKAEDADTACPLDAIMAGFRVVHDKQAIAYDSMPSTVKGEIRSRIRTTVVSMHGRCRKKHLMNPLRYPKYSWAIFSHRILRWLTPYFLLLAFLTSGLLLFLDPHPLWEAALISQLAFYLLAFLGYLLERNGVKIPGVSTIFTFSLVNIGFLLGTFRFLTGQRVFMYRSEQ